MSEWMVSRDEGYYKNIGTMQTWDDGVKGYCDGGRIMKNHHRINGPDIITSMGKKVWHKNINFVFKEQNPL